MRHAKGGNRHEVRFTRPKIIFFILPVALCTVYVGGCRRAGTWLVKVDVPPHADAMALLMGSFPERVLEAADLYHEGKAGRMLIVNESMGPYRLLESRGAEIIRTPGRLMMPQWTGRSRQHNDASWRRPKHHR